MLGPVIGVAGAARAMGGVEAADAMVEENGEMGGRIRIVKI